MMLNVWVQRLLGDIERLTLGYESVILAVTVLIGLVTIIFFIVVWSYVDPYEKAINEFKNRNRLEPLVSFFVAVRNDELAIVDCIESMLDQTYKNREIFVVDDASDDRTTDVLKQKFEDNTEISITYLEKNIGKKRALAKAIRNSKGEIFAFTDSDSVWKKDAIERIVTIFENDQNIGAISGHCNAKNADKNFLTRMQNSWYEKQYRLRKGFESVFGSVSCVSGPLACYRRATVFNYIPKWENDVFLGKEFRFATDRVMTGFALCGSKLGAEVKDEYSQSYFVKSENHPDKDWDVVYCSSAQAYTTVPENIGKIVSQKIRWNKSFIRNLFFTGKFYWKKPLLPALYYYLHVLYVFTSPILIVATIAIIILQGSFLLLAACFIGYMLLSYSMMLVLAPKKIGKLGDAFGILLHHLLFSWLIFYSIVTINKMRWVRDTVESD